MVFWVKIQCGNIDEYNNPNVTCTPKMELVGCYKLAIILEAALCHNPEDYSTEHLGAIKEGISLPDVKV